NGNCGHSALLCACNTRSQIGQRTLIIGRSGAGLGLFRQRLSPIFAAPLGRRAVTSVGRGFVGRLGSLLVRLRAGLVGFAAVVRLVEPRPLEQNCSPRAKDPPQLRLAALRAFLQRLVVDRLELVKVVFAGVALILVGWHGFFFYFMSYQLGGEWTSVRFSLARPTSFRCRRHHHPRRPQHAVVNRV